MHKFSEYNIGYMFEIYDMAFDARLYTNDSLDDCVGMLMYMGNI